MKAIDKICRLLWWVIQNWDKITRAKVKNFLGAKYRQHTSDDTVMQQFYWRQKLVVEKSPMCILSGKCVHCGCDTPDLFYGEQPCEGNCFPEWMEKEEWEDFKKTNNIAG
jgi:hypothetical protein